MRRGLQCNQNHVFGFSALLGEALSYAMEEWPTFDSSFTENTFRYSRSGCFLSADDFFEK